MNYRFNDLKKVAFSVGKEANNDFKVTFENLNHRFSEFIEIAFLAVQEAENEVLLISGVVATVPRGLTEGN